MLKDTIKSGMILAYPSEEHMDIWNRDIGFRYYLVIDVRKIYGYISLLNLKTGTITTNYKMMYLEYFDVVAR